ncbi:MAG: hypothetical protein FWF67_04520 [Fibromonadales bacterium]|nr:hypothetical protein [Fibromonadales bacterium]
MKILRISLILIMAQAVYALDPMYDYRYTLGPEILVPDAFHGSIGAFTYWNEDFTSVINFQLGITREFEIGAKYIGGTNNKWILDKKRHDPWDLSHLINIGAKYAISPHLTLQADAPIALNKDRDWGGVLSISQWDGYTKNVSFLFEGRLGFGGATSEKDSYVKPAAAFVPYFQIGESFRLSIGTIGSFSIGHFKDDAMLDILPKLELGLAFCRLTGEVSIGILTWKAEKYNRVAVFAVADL